MYNRRDGAYVQYFIQSVILTPVYLSCDFISLLSPLQVGLQFLSKMNDCDWFAASFAVAEKPRDRRSLFRNAVTDIQTMT